MNFPDTVTVIRPAAADAYGNPAADWTTPTEAPARGFLLDHTLFMPPTVDVRPGDRLRVLGSTYEIEGAPLMLRSPQKNILWSLTVARVPDGA